MAANTVVIAFAFLPVFPPFLSYSPAKSAKKGRKLPENPKAAKAFLALFLRL
jgi:hypothetical protein